MHLNLQREKLKIQVGIANSIDLFRNQITAHKGAQYEAII